MEGYYVAEVVKHVRALEATGWKAPAIFGDVRPLGGEDERPGAYKLHENSAAFATPEAWLKLMLETRESLDLLGISLGAWRRSKGLTEALLQKASDGCNVRILLLHQDNTCLSHLINSDIPEVDLPEVTREIAVMYDYFSKLSARNPRIQVRQIRTGCPHHNLTRMDQRAIYIPYLFSQKTGWSPLWECDRESILYKMLTEEFELLWRANAAG
jgi:hypothetical protein